MSARASLPLQGIVHPWSLHTFAVCKCPCSRERLAGGTDLDLWISRCERKKGDAAPPPLRFSYFHFPWSVPMIAYTSAGSILLHSPRSCLLPSTSATQNSIRARVLRPSKSKSAVLLLEALRRTFTSSHRCCTAHPTWICTNHPKMLKHSDPTAPWIPNSTVRE